LVSLNLTQVLPVSILIVLNHFFTCLARTHRRHAWCDRGITRKYWNHEAPRSTRKVLVAKQRHYWRKTDTKITHQQLLQLVIVMQERCTVKEKWRFIKSIRPLKRIRSKNGWICTLLIESIQIVSKQGIKYLDKMVNLVWAITYFLFNYGFASNTWFISQG